MRTDHRPLYSLSYGMYVVSAVDGERINGMMSTTVLQVTALPPQVGVCVNKQNTTHNMVMKSGRFAVSDLSITCPLVLIALFGFKHGLEVDKFKEVSYRRGKNGAPILLDHAVAYLEASVTGARDVGTHTLFVGEVTDMGVLSDEEPMTYTYYRKVLKGVTPKNAPTYVDPHIMP